VLVCFGGAGGQHACGVADSLGMETIYIHPLAGVLSAYGMGLAELRAIRETTIGKLLAKENLSNIRIQTEMLAKEAIQELVEQGVSIDNIVVKKILRVRYFGTDSSLEAPFGELSEIKAFFEKIHRRRFGFIDNGRALIIESVNVEAFNQIEHFVEKKLPGLTETKPKICDSAPVVFDSISVDTPIYNRKDLQPDHDIDGPAIIVEGNSTTVVEPGWSAEITNLNHLILRRVEARLQTPAANTDSDPIMLEVFNNLFMSVAEQMGAVLSNTSSSVNIKERLDFSCAVFDSKGGLIANAPHMPVHLGSMGESVRAIINDRGETISPGDVYALNAPYNGGTHLPDITVVTPMFDDQGESLLFFVGSRAHHADIGGITPGSMPPNSSTITEEGVLIENFLLVKGGVLREQALRDLLASGEFPARNINQNIADFKAQLAANQKGVQELSDIIDNFTLPIVSAYMAHVQANAAESVRRVLDELPDGEFENHMDDGSKIKVVMRINKKTRRAEIDFTGTSRQSNSNFNAPKAVCRAAVLYVFRCLVQDDIPLNDGCLEPLDIIIPERSILAPEFPAAVVAGNVETSQAITAALFGAAGVLAAAQGTMNNFTFGNEKHQYYETICGGAGASDSSDGASAVHTHMTNTRLTDPEVLEWRYPVILEAFGIRKNSGGKGRMSGGDGVFRRIRFEEKMTAAILSGSRKIFPFGLLGGGTGLPGRTTIITKLGDVKVLSSTDQSEMGPGDIILIETPGGGGFGKQIM